MSPADLQRLEGAIGRSLPAAVREFFLNFPPELRIADEDRDPDDSDFELTDDVEALIAMNTPGYDRIIIPGAGSNVLALGCGGCGETWWVNLDDERGAVHFCDAGTYAEDSDHVADSLAEFAQRMLDAE
jgi:hypothetical protein